jgi:uncharacterized membrane protein YbjE (DUF340 family)
MVVRIRFGKSSKLGKKRRKNRRVALLLAALLPPSALAAGILALWSVAADLNWANRFAISSGIFSHWHVWLCAAVAMQLGARALNRYGKGGDQATS